MGGPGGPYGHLARTQWSVLKRTNHTLREEFFKSRSQSRTTSGSNPAGALSSFLPPTRAALRESRPPLMSTAIREASDTARLREIPAKESEELWSGPFWLVVPVPRKGKSLHEPYERGQGPAPVITSEYRSSARNWSTLDGELVCTSANETFHSSWSCSRTVTRGAQRCHNN